MEWKSISNAAASKMQSFVSGVNKDNYEKLMERLESKGINPKPLDWYIDLRKNATFAHAGAGLGFDRLVSALTMVEGGNIRDAIPFPVAYKECSH